MIMDRTPQTKHAQTALWNGSAGHAWIAAQALLDPMFKPFEDHCVGIDVSAPMIAFARTRAQRERATASFICADAQTYAFEPASFDRIMSRFGVMFFDNPLQAFENLRRAARDKAELCCIAWRGATDNPFMTTAERAAAPLLPNLPSREPDAPGQFAFADPSRVSSILKGSGWTDIDRHPSRGSFGQAG